MGQEFELKFSADEAQQAAIAGEYGPWQRIGMETTYFDTADGALAARHMTLRRRLENGRSVCTVKTPRPDGARGEWECDCDKIEAAIAVLCRLGAPKELLSLTRAGLIEVCGARFERRCCRVVLEDAEVELALDSGVLLGGGREIPLREVEVEHKSGNRGTVIYFGVEMAEHYGLAPQPYSKFHRALALAQEEQL